MASKTTTTYFVTGSDEAAVKKAAVALAAELAPGADARKARKARKGSAI